MERLGLTFALATTLLLTSCGLFSTTFSDNPLGLDGRPVTVRVVAPQQSSLVPMAEGEASLSVTFGDLDTPVSPGSISLDLPFAGTALVTVASGPAPSEIILSDFELELDITDGSNEPANITLNPTVNATLTSAPSSQQTGPLTYNVTDVSIEGSLSSDQVSAFNDVVSDGGLNTLTVTLRLTATSTPDLPEGSEITMEFENTSVTVGL